MDIVRWTLLDRVRKAHPGLPVENTCGYLTKNTRITPGLPKAHCVDACCIAGNLKAVRRGVCLHQRQMRKHNRQIHKCTILLQTLEDGTKIGYRKLNQTPHMVKNFRLFDKVRCLGQTGFIFGRRSSGCFDVRRLDGVKLSSGISYRKLTLLEKRGTHLTELIKEDGASSSVRRQRFLRRVSMNKPCTYLLSALMASAVLAPVAALAADKSELEVRMEAAQKVLADRSYYERWSPEAALKTVEDAKAANEAGSARQKEIDGALDVMKDWCHTRFLVNACIKDARDLHHEREKEIRSVRLKADEMIRLDRVEQRRALEEANVRAYEEKQARAARKAEERHDPIRVKSRVKAPSSPIEGHLGRTAADVEAGRAEAAERMAQEDANIAAFNAKQAEAKKRLEEAEATAAERKASREARQANFNKTLEERRAAQKRYEESRENKDSGLKKYF